MSLDLANLQVDLLRLIHAAERVLEWEADPDMNNRTDAPLHELRDAVKEARKTIELPLRGS